MDYPDQPDDWTLPDVIASRARQFNTRTAITEVDGRSVSYAQLHQTTLSVAEQLTKAGVQPNSQVALMATNHLEFVYAWLAINQLGATCIIVNTELKGAFLHHVLADSQSTVLLMSSQFIDSVTQVIAELPSLTSVVFLDGDIQPIDDRQCRSIDYSYRCNSPLKDSVHSVKPEHISCIMYTSGTTGPPKGVMMPHAHCYLFALGTLHHLSLTEQDNYYIVLPLFHANGLLMQLYACLLSGATATVRHKFSASNWLTDIQTYGATVSNTLGIISAFVLAQPATTNDKQHQLRAITSAPNPPEAEQQFRERFGIQDVIGLYGMTEVNIPLYGECGTSRPGACGRVWSEFFEVIIADPNTDQPLPANQTGEILVRPKHPFGFMSGYYQLPEKTLEAWRNLWFHTGDAAYMSDDGYVYFVDRIKDCIRVGGENVSSFAVEQVLETFEGILEVAVVAVPSQIVGGEDEIKAYYVAAEAHPIDQSLLADHAKNHLPKFAVPKHFQSIDQLPKTATGKIQKAKLRD